MAFLTAESFRNEKEDRNAAGFYNIDVKQAMKNDQIYAILISFSILNQLLKRRKQGYLALEYFKEVLETYQEAPSGTEYQFKGSAGEWKTRDMLVLCCGKWVRLF